MLSSDLPVASTGEEHDAAWSSFLEADRRGTPALHDTRREGGGLREPLMRWAEEAVEEHGDTVRESGEGARPHSIKREEEGRRIFFHMEHEVHLPPSTFPPPPLSLPPV